MGPAAATSCGGVQLRGRAAAHRVGPGLPERRTGTTFGEAAHCSDLFYAAPASPGGCLLIARQPPRKMPAERLASVEGGRGGALRRRRPSPSRLGGVGGLDGIDGGGGVVGGNATPAVTRLLRRSGGGAILYMATLLLLPQNLVWTGSSRSKRRRGSAFRAASIEPADAGAGGSFLH